MPGEGRDLTSRRVSEGGTAGRLALSLATPLTVGKRQRTLRAKAKGSPSYWARRTGRRTGGADVTVVSGHGSVSLRAERLLPWGSRLNDKSLDPRGDRVLGPTSPGNEPIRRRGV